MNQDSYCQQYVDSGQLPLENQEIVEGIAALLEDLAQEGDNDENSLAALEPFNSLKVPSISLPDYLARIIKHAQCSQECLIMGLIYIDRLSHQHGRIILKSINVHRLYVVAVMISAKFYDDRFFQNVYYAKVAGISPEEFNSLEQLFLFQLNFKLLIDPLLFFKYRERIIVNYCSQTE